MTRHDHQPMRPSKDKSRAVKAVSPKPKGKAATRNATGSGTKWKAWLGLK